jgi:glycine betaine/proline transport system ATP-binding protein
MLEFQSRLKKTILFVSHDLDEAFRIGNRIAIMEGGRVIQCGTPQEIARRPVNEYVSDFVRHLNPLEMLTASGVMRACETAFGEPISSTARPAARLTDVIDAMRAQPSAVGVVDNGVIVGVISARDVVAGLTLHRKA